MSANSTVSWVRRSNAPGRSVPGPVPGGWSSTWIPSWARPSGPRKQGAAFGYTRVRGYHPILATRADTGEVLHIRLRKGSANTSRGFGRFLDELLARVKRAGATGPRLLRADSGFWNRQTFARLDRAGWQFSIGVRLQPAIRAAIDTISESAWIDLPDYPKTSIAQIAETTYGDHR